MLIAKWVLKNFFFLRKFWYIWIYWHTKEHKVRLKLKVQGRIENETQDQSGGQILDEAGQGGGGSWKLGNFHGSNMCIVPYVIFQTIADQRFLTSYLVCHNNFSLLNLSQCSLNNVIPGYVMPYRKIFFLFKPYRHRIFENSQSQQNSPLKLVIVLTLLTSYC